MSKPGKQFSLVGGVGSGAGALHAGAAPVDQTGNLLGILATVHTPNVKVGHSHTNFAGKKLRFGGVAKDSGHMFDYPDLAIKEAGGNGQAYRATKGGYLPGNNNAGAAGYGHTREFDRSTMVSGDLTDAYRVADYHEHPDIPEHFRTLNRDYESIKEHIEEQRMEHEKEKITHLMAMGFSEEEIRRKADKDREKAIEQASQMNLAPGASLERAIMRAMPTTDIGLSVAPGLMPNRKDADSYQRAVGAGTLTTKGKAAEAMRRREQMAQKLDGQKPEQPKVHEAKPHSAIVDLMMSLGKHEEHKRQENSMVRQEQVVHHQKMREDARQARHFAMSKAMEKK